MCSDNVFTIIVRDFLKPARKFKSYNFFLPIRKKAGELPTLLPMGCRWATEWAARGNIAM